MNAVRSYNVSLKYQRSTSSGCKDIGITKIEFVTKTQFLCINVQDWVVYTNPLFKNFLKHMFAFSMIFKEVIGLISSRFLGSL